MDNFKKSKIGNLFILSAPTGAGKTTISYKAVKELEVDFNIKKLVTYTTRNKRPSEQNGLDYFFIDYADFFIKKQNNFFLETTQYNNQWYGSPRSCIEELNAGISLVAVTDFQGAVTYQKNIAQTVLILITVPNFDTLCQRLQKRDAGNSSIDERIAIAAKEFNNFSIERTFDYVVINDELIKATHDIQRIIKYYLQ